MALKMFAVFRFKILIFTPIKNPPKRVVFHLSDRSIA